jgi:hypothetical protein
MKKFSLLLNVNARVPINLIELSEALFLISIDLCEEYVASELSHLV